MALHPDLPRSPYAPLHPAHRWFPADEALRASAYARLLPPLVAHIREAVAAWRESGCAGASETSRALLRWWFATEHAALRPDGTTGPSAGTSRSAKRPDGTLFNPDGIDDEGFFQALEDIRAGRLP